MSEIFLDNNAWTSACHMIIVCSTATVHIPYPTKESALFVWPGGSLPQASLCPVHPILEVGLTKNYLAAGCCAPTNAKYPPCLCQPTYRRAFETLRVSVTNQIEAGTG